LYYLPHEYVYNLAWEILINQQLISGAIPGPESDIYNRENSPETKKAINDQLLSFEHCYHTTLTTLIAGSLRFNRENTSQNLLETTRSEKNSESALKSENKIEVQALEKAYEFLLNDIKKLSNSGNWKPKQAAYDLVGIWIFESIFGNRHHINNVIDRISNLSRNNQQISINFNELDYQDLYIFTLGGLLTTGYRKTIPEFKEITTTVINNLHNNILHAPGINSIQIILSNLHLIQASPDLSPKNIEKIFEKSNFLNSKKAILNFISFADQYGHIEEKQYSITRKFVNVLEGIVSNYFREYHLLDGMYALRCLNQLDTTGNGIINLASNFLCTHQQSSGVFGYLGPELDLRRTLEEDTSSSSSIHFDGEYFLIKITQAAIWTIAETLDSGWTLTRAFTGWCNQTT